MSVVVDSLAGVKSVCCFFWPFLFLREICSCFRGGVDYDNVTVRGREAEEHFNEERPMKTTHSKTSRSTVRNKR